jgi:tetratricopeptide (TPR) repeat protein
MLRPVLKSLTLGCVLAACASTPKPTGSAATTSGAEFTQPLSDRRGKLLALHEILKRMEASPVQYKVADLGEYKDAAPEQLIEKVWPWGSEPLDFPAVETGPDGKRSVRPYPGDAEVMALLEQAEVPYQAGRFEEAERIYAQALQLRPQCYPAMLSYGDAALFKGDPASALIRYEQATALNPDDHRSYFYRGTALRALGRMKEARAMYAWALALRPSNPYLLDVLGNADERLGVRLQPAVLKPRALARQEGEAVAVYADMDHPSWLGFGMCKGFWLGDSSHRQEMLGTTGHPWTSLEETECIAALATGYSRNREKQQDPALERLIAIIGDGYATELILYEVASRKAPHIVLTLNEAQRQRMQAYVLEHVLAAQP